MEFVQVASDDEAGIVVLASSTSEDIDTKTLGAAIKAAEGQGTLEHLEATAGGVITLRIRKGKA